MKMRGIPGFRDFALAPRAILESLAAMRLLDRRQAALRLPVPPRGEDDMPANPEAAR